MERRTLLAVILSSAILIAYYGFFYKPPKVAPPASVATSDATSTTMPSTESAPEPSVENPPSPSNPVQTSEVENSLVKANFTSSSGLPEAWLMKEFFQKADGQGGNIDLFAGDDSGIGIFLTAGRNPALPLYALQPDVDQELIYRGVWNGLSLEQKIEFGKKDYSFDVTLKIKNQSAKAQSLTPGLRLNAHQAPPVKKKAFGMLGEAPQVTHPLYFLNGTVERQPKVDKMGPYSEKSGELAWVGLEDRYFLRAVLARKMSAQNQVAYGAENGQVYADFRYAPENIAPGEEKEYAFTVYLGPKNPSYLNAFTTSELDKAIDYGWFAVVARPILMALKFFYTFLHNWGLAIIFLTIVIKILLLPLTRQSMKSMKKMQQLQPQLQKLREKYPNDREKLNVETMNLFRANKANPMGGCLPMIIQMPIYIALYKVLYNATELYHAPFFGFYRDLSASDPYFILPVLLGIFMLLQQKLTPNVGDPAQAKAMMFMPILFTVFMLFLPLGLVLYIFVNTVMTVAQQYMHQKDIRLFGFLSPKSS